MRTETAFFFTIIMIIMPFSGCLSTEKPEETTSQVLDEWNVFFAATYADLPVCDSITNGRLYYIEDIAEFQVCKTAGWEVINITGPIGVTGAAGPAGSSGTAGVDGQDGIDGASGSSGSDGNSTMIHSLASTTCTSGGITFQIGIDDDGNGVLDTVEVRTAVDICNGNDGQNGLDGINGTTDQSSLNEIWSAINALNSTTDSLQIMSERMACYGNSTGWNISVGYDDGRGIGNAGDDILQPAEILSSTHLCDAYYGILKDLELGTASSIIYSPFTKISNNWYFLVRASSTYGTEIWVTDGTTAGTHIFIDINPGTGNGAYFPYALADGSFLFYGTDSTSGSELWHSDGSIGGTNMLIDINIGANDSLCWGNGPQYINFNNAVYFCAFDEINGATLWRTDGTQSGTFSTMDPDNSSEGQGDLKILGFINQDKIVIGAAGKSWSTDGTYENTTLFYNTQGKNFHSFGNYTLFIGWNPSAGGNYTLWRTDGTANGTTGLGISFDIMQLYEMNGKVYFTHNNNSNFEWWKSDGTIAGTQMITDDFGLGYHVGSSTWNMRPFEIDGKWYFETKSNAGFFNIYVSDGTAAGTSIIYENWTRNGYGTNFVKYQNKIFFEKSYELWITDGTVAGTHVFNSSSISSAIISADAFMVSSDNELLFIQGESTNFGRELYILYLPQ